MIIEITTSCVALGIVGTTYFAQKGAVGNDTQKIVRISKAAGLTDLRPHRRTRKTDHTEYVFQLPEGYSAQQFRDKLDRFQDGLNMKHVIPDVSLSDIKAIDWRGNIPKQIADLLAKKKRARKEVEIDFDGMLKFRVYHESLTDFLPFDESLLARCKGWEIPLGQSRDRFISHDTELGHMVVAGVTQYGKSVFLKNLVTSLISRKPDDVKFSLIDLKGGLTFARFKHAKQVDTVAKDAFECLATLNEIDADMTAKQALYLAQGYENIREAKDSVRHFIIVDEAAQLASKGVTDSNEKAVRVECERLLARIAAIGSGLGYRLIFCTQYPTADTLPRQVKQNADTRICFRLQTSIASHVVLDEDGAEQLPKIRGRAIYLTPDGKQIVQTPFIENKQIEPIITLNAREESDNHAPIRKANKHTLIVEETGVR